MALLSKMLLPWEVERQSPKHWSAGPYGGVSGVWQPQEREMALRHWEARRC